MDIDYIKNYVSNVDLVKANFIEVLKECFKFDGTLNRTKYFTYTIVWMVLSVLISSVSSVVWAIPVVGWIIGLILMVVGFVPCIVVIGPAVRRLRDAGFSPWLLLCVLICGVGGVVPCILTFFPSKYPSKESDVPTEAAQPVSSPEANQPSEN